MKSAKASGMAEYRDQKTMSLGFCSFLMVSQFCFIAYRQVFSPKFMK